MTSKIYNVNVVNKTILPTPADIKAELPMTPAAERTVLESRETIRSIIDGRDPRLFVVVGPCSVHDIDAAHELYQMLLAPVLKPLGDIKHLIVVADGPLRSLPFGLLVTEQWQLPADKELRFERYRDVPWEPGTSTRSRSVFSTRKKRTQCPIRSKVTDWTYC